MTQLLVVAVIVTCLLATAIFLFTRTGTEAALPLILFFSFAGVTIAGIVWHFLR